VKLFFLNLTFGAMNFFAISQNPPKRTKSNPQ
jgi:hypothetical protein